jgi:hypothetical protein
MTPMSKRALLVFVLLTALLSCSATFSAAQPDRDTHPPVITFDSGGVVQVSSEGYIEERHVVPGKLVRMLRETAEGSSIRVKDWPVSPGDHRSIRIERRAVYGPETRIFEIGKDGRRELPRSAHLHFIGEIEDEPGSGVLVILDPRSGRLQGLTVSDGMTFDLLPVEGGKASEIRVVAAHERVAGEDPHWGCGEEDLDGSPLVPARRSLSGSAEAEKAGSPLEAVLAIDTDVELLTQKFNGSTSAATDYIADLIAAMNVMYSRDLNVTLIQGTTFLRTSSDPYTATGGSASSTALNEFRSYWASNYGSVPRALAAMLSGTSSSSNSASGIAWVGGLCSSSIGYSFSKVFKMNYLAGDAKLVGHELGHNFGSPHTHCYSPPIDECYNESGCFAGTTSCPGGAGTLMSYCHITGCGSTLDFHPRATDNILSNYVAPATGVCLFEASDGLFTDGFERGSTSSWSITAP